MCVCVRTHHTHNTYTSTPCKKWGDTSIAQRIPHTGKNTHFQVSTTHFPEMGSSSWVGWLQASVPGLAPPQLRFWGLKKWLIPGLQSAFYIGPWEASRLESLKPQIQLRIKDAHNVVFKSTWLVDQGLELYIDWHQSIEKCSKLTTRWLPSTLGQMPQEVMFPLRLDTLTAS